MKKMNAVNSVHVPLVRFAIMESAVLPTAMEKIVALTAAAAAVEDVDPRKIVV